MKIKHLTLLLVSGTLLVVPSLNAQAKATPITARQLVERIKKNVTCPWSQRTNDTFKAGDPDTKVSGIAVTFMATYDVLRRAKKRQAAISLSHTSPPIIMGRMINPVWLRIL